MALVISTNQTSSSGASESSRTYTGVITSFGTKKFGYIESRFFPKAIYFEQGSTLFKESDKPIMVPQEVDFEVMSNPNDPYSRIMAVNVRGPNGTDLKAFEKRPNKIYNKANSNMLTSSVTQFQSVTKTHTITRSIESMKLKPETIIEVFDEDEDERKPCVATDKFQGVIWRHVAFGYGFILPKGKEAKEDALYFYIGSTNIRLGNQQKFEIGQSVEYSLDHNSNGKPIAIDITGPKGTPLKTIPFKWNKN